MHGEQWCCGGLPHLSFLGGVFEGEANEFGGFIGGELAGGGGAGAWLHNGRERSAPAGEFGEDERNGAGVSVGQTGIDRLHGLPSCGPLRGGQDFLFGRVDRRDGFPREADGVALRSDVIGGLAGFEGLLARPVQRSRYWSRSKPLPLSRSFHQASPWRARSSSAARTADSMIAS